MGHIWGPGLQHMGLFQHMGKKMLPQAQHMANLLVIFSNICGALFNHIGASWSIWGLSQCNKNTCQETFSTFFVCFCSFTISFVFVCLFKVGISTEKMVVYFERFYMKEKKKKRLLKKEENLSDCSVTVTTEPQEVLAQLRVDFWFDIFILFHKSGDTERYK